MNTDKTKRLGFLFSLSAFICVHLWFLPSALADKHTFVYDASKDPTKPRQGFVAGDFNGWSKAATPMTDEGLGQYKATVDLTEGIHFYKFVVNGDKWVNDPASDRELEADDGNGGKNSAVMIGPDARKLPKPKPDAIN